MGRLLWLIGSGLFLAAGRPEFGVLRSHQWREDHGERDPHATAALQAEEAGDFRSALCSLDSKRVLAGVDPAKIEAMSLSHNTQEGEERQPTFTQKASERWFE